MKVPFFAAGRNSLHLLALIASLNISQTADAAFQNFITVSGGKFYDGPNQFRFTASSEPLMMRLSNYGPGAVDSTNTWVNYINQSMDVHVRLGMKAVRIWADPELTADSMVTY